MDVCKVCYGRLGIVHLSYRNWLASVDVKEDELLAYYSYENVTGSTDAKSAFTPIYMQYLTHIWT